VNDSVHGIELSGGIEQWSNTDLTGRRITAPAVIGGNVVVGDEYGYLHFMNMATGSMSGRLEVGSDVYAAAVVAGDTLYVQTRDGTLLAVRI
jgi:outer membrane protein assembly factor BamB